MAATSDFDHPRDKNDDDERKAKAILNVLLERYKDRRGAEEEKETMDAEMKRMLFPAEGEDPDGKKKENDDDLDAMMLGEKIDKGERSRRSRRDDDEKTEDRRLCRTKSDTSTIKRRLKRRR